tara:strand:+ start:2044 stop:3489 length:1446 start_codon:yes stop_codon:yes gene_type:complete
MKIISSLLIALFFSLIINGQEDKTVTLSISGQGKTQDEAKQNALRNAIEQAFGTFISSNTEILNDELVKDEIVSVSNGNIQKFEIISEVNISEGEYSTTLKATVSVSKLTSFAESKGVEVEFKGSLFSFNIKQQKFNKENEEKSIINLFSVVDKLSSNSFDYEISVSDPVLKAKSDPEIYVVKSYISVFANNNFLTIPDLIYSTLDGLSLTKEEVIDYNNTGIPIYGIEVSTSKHSSGTFYLRSKNSYTNIVALLANFKKHLLNFVVSNSIYNYHVLDNPFNVDYIYDGGFQIFKNVFRRRLSYNRKSSPSFQQQSMFYNKTNDSRSSMQDYNKIGLNINMKYYNLINGDGVGKITSEDSDNVFGIPSLVFSGKYSYSSLKRSSYFGVIDRNIDWIYGITSKEGSYILRKYTYSDDNSIYCKLNFDSINIKSELLRIYFSDYLSLDDVMKIKKYSVKPYNPSIQLDLVKYNEKGILTVEKY